MREITIVFLSLFLAWSCAGSDGEDGAQGPVGKTGPVGETGVAGQDGASGIDGQSCAVVDNGDGSYTLDCPGGESATLYDGEDGAEGRAGVDGEDGQDGQDGAVGAVGPAGPQGEQGATGPAGPQGEQRLQGTPGEGFFGYACAEDDDCNDGLSCSGIGLCLLAEDQGCLQSAQCATGLCSASSSSCKGLGERISIQDFNTLSDADHQYPSGLWSDGATLWAADIIDCTIYAYDLASKARKESQDFDTSSATGAGPCTPSSGHYGLWSDGATMWVADSANKKIYAYDLLTKTRDSARDFSNLSATGNRDPRGLWSDGATMWVADSAGKKIYAYDLASKTRIASQDFDTLIAAGNHAPYGLWSDGLTMWVVDEEDEKLYAYDLLDEGKARRESQEFDTLTGGSTGPLSLWSDGATMWVGQGIADIYAHELTGR